MNEFFTTFSFDDAGTQAEAEHTAMSAELMKLLAWEEEEEAVLQIPAA